MVALIVDTTALQLHCKKTFSLLFYVFDATAHQPPWEPEVYKLIALIAVVAVESIPVTTVTTVTTESSGLTRRGCSGRVSHSSPSQFVPSDPGTRRHKTRSGRRLGL